MGMNALPKTNYIKTIVTAEAKLDLERKGVQSYQRDGYARFLCFGNGALTSLYDHSDGTKDKPTDCTDDPFLVEKKCTSIPRHLPLSPERRDALCKKRWH